MDVSVAIATGNTPSEDIPSMDNSGNGPLRVPGFGGIPIHFELPLDARFAHGNHEWQQTPAATACELAMVATMNRITDYPNWHIDVFNDQVVADWEKEAFETTPLMSEQAWKWCVAELLDKAAYFRENQYVRVLEVGSCVCKSEIPGLQSLSELFRETVPYLLEQKHQQKHQQNPDSLSDQVLGLVDPSLFPLVYGRTLVLTNGGKVDLDNIHGFYADAMVSPSHFDRRVDSMKLQSDIEKHGPLSMGHDANGAFHGFYRWSSNYQRLPCEVEFLGDSGTEVKVTSYINNLNPAHEGLYKNIEKLISLAIKPWNACLIKGQSGMDDSQNLGQKGPVPLRIITWGIEWVNELPEWAVAFRVPGKVRQENYRKAKEAFQSTIADQTRSGREKNLWAQQRLAGYADVKGRENMELPPPDSDLWQRAKDYLAQPENGSISTVQLPDDWKESEHSLFEALEKKVKKTIYWKHPQPGNAFSYKDWQTNQHNNNSIIDIVRQRAGHKKGLQVLIEMKSIELTPSTPISHSDAWQLEGQLNDHIVGVAVFAYDVENITTPHISFRQHTMLYGDYYRYKEWQINSDKYHFRARPAHQYGKNGEVDILAEILGFPPPYLYADVLGDPPVQGTGSVAMRQGRLVTFSNAIESRMEQFQLVDPASTGHFRAIKLFLVDPHYRVCSTRNVPPQQHDWWAQEVDRDLASTGLPREMVDHVLRETDDWPMGIQEAKEHRKELKKEQLWNEQTRLSCMDEPAF
ncbi:hypothetical protein N7490_010057 [Penicillium lividum]|nr:hypothetical protein N7490_010057 [Penicillium lividum]